MEVAAKEFKAGVTWRTYRGTHWLAAMMTKGGDNCAIILAV